MALGPAVALGLARFAYALLLPSMRAELHWSFAIAGALNTANAFGYLAGALLAAPTAHRWGTRRAFLAGLGVTVASLLATAATVNVTALIGLRTLAGVTGAICFVTGAGIVAEAGTAGSARRAASLLGIYFAGGGAGIVASGLAIPFLLAATPAADGWRWGWVLLAGLGLTAFGIATPAARASREPPNAPPADRHWPARHFRALLAGYALFGVGYIAYMTFIVAFLKDHGAGPGEITAFWVVLGAASIAGAFLWVRPVVNLRGGRAPGLVLAVVSVGAFL
ncbi:MAG: YbfB/YjiJ family MFS transporter, partial [Candidatus Dormibacteria bacterium]